MKCPICGSDMGESHDAKNDKNRMFECDNCGNAQDAFSAYASTEGYPADKEEFELWREQRGL